MEPQFNTVSEEVFAVAAGARVRPIRSQQVDNRTGLTLNEQRRLNTKVRRGVELLDAAKPNWYRNRYLLEEDLWNVSQNIQTFFEDEGYQELTAKALKAGHRIAKAHIFDVVNAPEIDGEQFGVYIGGLNYTSDVHAQMGLGLAWTKAIIERRTADTARKLMAKRMPAVADVL